MKKLMIIGGIGMITMAGTSMVWHKQKPKLGPNELAIAIGTVTLSVGITIRF